MSPDVVVTLENCSVRVAEILARAEKALRSTCEKMFPDDLSPASITWLLNWFEDDDDPVVEFRNEQTRAGAAGALSLVLAHGVEVDLDKVTSGIPSDEQGHPVDMTPFAEAADAPAGRVVELLVRRQVESKSTSVD